MSFIHGHYVSVHINSYKTNKKASIVSVRQTQSASSRDTDMALVQYWLLTFEPNICRRNLKANLPSVGAQNVMMLEIAGLSGKRGTEI